MAAQPHAANDTTSGNWRENTPTPTEPKTLTPRVGLQRRDLSNQDAFLAIPLAAAAMTPDYFTGLDLHKRSVTATTLDAAGAVVATAKMPCRPKALLAYFAQTPGHHAATVECTTGWYWVRDALARRRPPPRPRQGRQGHRRGQGQDRCADAAMLAHLLRTDLLPEAHMISDEMRPLRDVLRTRLTTGRAPRGRAELDRPTAGEAQRPRRGRPRRARPAPGRGAHRAGRAAPRAKSSGWRERSSPTSSPTPTCSGCFAHPRHRQGVRLLDPPRSRRHRALRHRPGLLQLLPPRARRRQLGRPGPSQAEPRRQPLPQAGLQPRRRPGDPVLPRGPGVVRGQEAQEARGVARALVAKEIARIVYHVLRKQEDFNGRFKGEALSRTKKELWPLLASPASITGAGGDPGLRPPSAGMGSE